MVKALNFFFIITQIRIYESEAFKKFMRVDLRQLMTMANNYKANIIKYMYNNKKLEDIIKSQQKTKLMYKDLQKLKDIVLDYQRRTKSLLAFGNQSYLSDNNTTPLLNKSQ
jgi:hypothetical protein